MPGVAVPQAWALQQALQHKTQGLNFLSHELRTPLQALLALAACIQDESVQASVCTHAADMQHTLHSMHGLLNEVLELARAEQHALRLENQPFDVHALVQRVLRLYAPLAQTKGVALQCQGSLDHSLWVMGDAHRLEQMLNNLLGNALKFTEQGRVWLECKATPAQAHVDLCLAVHDTGIGISQSTLRRLFQPFAQADATVYPRFGGSGLGLLLVQTLARAMGGRLEVNSTPAVGSVFALHLCLNLAACASNAAQGAGQLAPAQPHTLRILLVDDHPINTKILSHLIVRRGHQVQVASSCAQARALYAHYQPHAVLLDIHLPDGSGLDLCQEWVGPNKPRVCLLSGAPTELMAQALQTSGAESYLQKPVLLPQFNELLRTWQNSVGQGRD